MGEKVFRAPVRECTVTSLDEATGQSVSLLLHDRDWNVFSLRIQTQRGYTEEVKREATLQQKQRLDATEEVTSEPVFCVPGDHLDQRTIEQVVRMDAKLLMQYLVSQDES